MNLKGFLKNKVVTNAGWIIGGKIAQQVVNLIVGVLMARYLGPSNNGLVNYGAAYTAFFTSFANLGINSVLVKEFVDHPDEEGKIIGTSLFLRTISSILSAIIIICIVRVMDADEPVTILVVALCSLSLFFHIFEVIKYWFQSRLQSKVSAIVTLIAYMITALYKVILMINGKSVVWFAFATSVDYIFIAILLMYAYRKYNGGRFQVSLEYGRALLRKSWHFILPGLMISIFHQTDKMMLKQMVGDAELGFYSTAISLSNAWCFVLAAIIDSVYPSIMQANNKDEKVFEKRNKQLYAIVFYFSISVSLVITLFAGLIIRILYGEAYMPTVLPLQIIVWYTAFSYLGVARNAWVVCKNCQKYLIYIYGASALANVLINWALIPVMGAAGASIASLVTQIMTTMVVPFFIKDMRPNWKMICEAILLKGVIGK